MQKKKSLVHKFLYGFVYAFRGIKSGFLSEINLKFHAIAASMVIIAGFYFHVTRNDWLWLIAAIGFVFVTEYLNTSLEKLTDLVSQQPSELCGRAKDLGAAAVLIAAISAAVIGVIIFWQYIFK